MNIVEQQALKLVNERWMDIDKAVDIAIEQQKKRWFVKDWKITQRWQQYGKLTSEQREEVRYAVEKWASINDFSFEWGKVTLIPKA